MKIIQIQCGKKIVSKKARLLENSLEWVVGMMFKKEGELLMHLMSEDASLSSIHTFFCVPLVVAWLDKNLEVVDVAITKPFWFYTPKKPAMYIFETTDMKKRIKVGEKWKISKKH